MTIQELLKDPPLLHRGGNDQPISYRLSDESLRFIDGQVGPGSRTLETGAGLSTILFALKGAAHTCVAPDPVLVERIKAYCAEHRIAAGNVDFQIARSETVLPRLQLEPLDLVVIDGRHAFPTPFIDWYYTAAALKPGGFLLIDDTQLWTGSVLKGFLAEEPEWRWEKDFSARAAVFTKLAEGSHLKWWGQQPYLVRKSKRLMRLHDVRQAFSLLGRGELSTLFKKVRSNLKRARAR